MTYTATYSPEDNKLRLYASERLPEDVYARVKAAGFSWAPKQGLFVAPMWTPQRDDLLIELAGEIGDEDTSLVERAEQRAERFEDYQEKRAADAESAHAAVEQIANGIPLGQPILVGHHSERRARKDAERIENGMRKAVKMWETSQYWKDRAAGALAHAKYKELPDVRVRRIKAIKADLKRCQAAYTPQGEPRMMQKWNAGPDDAPVPHVITGQGRAKHYTPVESLARVKAGYVRWETHYNNRILYETAMLNEQGEGHRLAPKPRPKQLPLLNYKADVVTVHVWGRDETYPVVSMTSEQFKSIYSDYRGCAPVGGTHRVRTALVCKDGTVKRFPHHSESMRAVVFLTDSKSHPVPTPKPAAPAKEPPMELALEADSLMEEAATNQKQIEEMVAAAAPMLSPLPESNGDKFEAMRRALRGGVSVQVVSAPQLFPTPPHIAEMVMMEADIQPGECVLEPSAGTGNLITPIVEGVDTEILAYEINPQLCEALRAKFPSHRVQVRQADFLEVTDHQGQYPKIVMNPPFANGADIKHIIHAMTFLAPGGRLVAICANGPRQQEKLRPLADSWVELPDGSFEDSGTQVRTAMMIYNKPTV